MISRLRSGMAEYKEANRQAERKFQAQTLADMARTPLLEKTLVVAGDSADWAKYEKAALVLHDELQRALTERQLRLNSDAILKGCKVFGKLALRGMEAYAAHGQQTGQPLHVDELQATLVESYQPAVTTFSNLPNKHSGHMELMFGLKTGMPCFEPVPFRIQSDETSATGLRLVPSDYTLLEAKRDPDWPGDNYPTDQRCPASGIMLKKVWAAMIATCAESEHLFPADVATANGQQIEISQLVQPHL